MPGSRIVPDKRLARLPGFGLPILYYQQHRKKGLKFPTRLTCSEGISYRELRMLEFINDITDKPDWHERLCYETTVKEWREEARRKVMGVSGFVDIYLSDKMFYFCIEELIDKAFCFQQRGYVTVLDTEMSIVKYDGAIKGDVRMSLQRLVRRVEHDIEADPDDSGIVHVLDPSWYPVVYGETCATTKKVTLDNCLSLAGEGKPVNKWPDIPDEERWGETYKVSTQWLPTEVELNHIGAASIVSYINNLHPERHAELYWALGQAISTAVPLWEECLSRSWDRRRIPRSKPHWTMKRGEIPKSDPHQGFSADKRNPARSNICRTVSLQSDFPEGLQVIFRLTNIQLTPARPVFKGGKWHTEGFNNEMICATALMHYESENITDCSHSFQHYMDAVDFKMKALVSESFGRYLNCLTRNDSAPVQQLGSVKTPEERMIAWPNRIQHKLEAFKVADPEKPGHTKILVMHLVDPHRPILSTANVPPQQRDWWVEKVMEDRALPVPAEIMMQILDEVDGWPMSAEVASQHLRKSRYERKKVVAAINADMRCVSITTEVEDLL